MGGEIGAFVTEINPRSTSCVKLLPELDFIFRSERTMSAPFFDANSSLRAAGKQSECVSGKFFVHKSQKVLPRGVTYGPFPLNLAGESYPEPERLTADLESMVEMGIGALRIYHWPSPHLLDEALRLGLRLWVGIPWTDHVDFLRSWASRRAVIMAVEKAAQSLGRHPAVAAFLVGNEIEKTLVRWLGPARTQAFLEELIAAGRKLAPDRLFSYATYPSTSYLVPRNADFLAVNLFLEDRDSFSATVQKLHHLAGDRPLVITEFGLDHLRHGAAAQAAARVWFEEECRANAVAGMFWFSFTDEWFRGGQLVLDWQFGLVDAQRRPRPAAFVRAGVSPELCSRLTVSVVVCTYNGQATLAGCLESLLKQSHPALEILVVDDGSPQDILNLVSGFPGVRYLRQEHSGLSAARNLGMAATRGDIIAYTDDDCIAEEEWLARLLAGFDDSCWVACGGPNVPPSPRGPVEAVVAAAPGAPAHVMLDDLEAEHLPGCNLAIRREALQAIGGFRDHYRLAGDDVDVCWRLREIGGQLRFVPGAMVWHHRRRTVMAYLRQQRGYGQAEALLRRDHPDRFGLMGGARWRGAIYGEVGWQTDLRAARIFHGPQGDAPFQGIYQPMQGRGGLSLLLAGSLLLVTTSIITHQPFWLGFMPLLALVPAWRLWRTHWRRPYPLGWRGELLLFLFCLLQPWVRGCAQIQGMIRLGVSPEISGGSWPAVCGSWLPHGLRLPALERAFWSETGKGREAWLQQAQIQLCQRRGLSLSVDDGWQAYDLSWCMGQWLRYDIITVTEEHGHSHRLTRVRLVARLTLGLVMLALCLVLMSPWAAVALSLGLLADRWRCRRWMDGVASQVGLKSQRA